MSKSNYANRMGLSKKQSNTMKKLILTNKFTPKTENRLNHSRLEYKGKKYRSSWEIVFHYLNPNMLYEQIRIPYKLKNGEEHIYISDFYDVSTNTIYEIKPDKIYKDLSDKMEAIESSIKQNTNYNYVHLGDNWAKSIHLDENCDIDYEIIKMFKKGCR